MLVFFYFKQIKCCHKKQLVSDLGLVKIILSGLFLRTIKASDVAAHNKSFSQFFFFGQSRGTTCNNYEILAFQFMVNHLCCPGVHIMFHMCFKF